MLRGTRDQLFIASGRANVATAALYGLIASAMSTAVYAHAHYPTWRIVVPLALFATMLGAQLLTLHRIERNPICVQGAVARLHMFAQLYLVGVVTATGGLHSPALPAVGASIAMPAVFFGRQTVSRVLMCTQLLLFLGMALLPRAWLGPALPHGHHAAVAVIVFAWTVLMIHALVSRLQDANDAATAAVDELRDEQVAASAEQLCRLQSVGAKVAHELKNPLASIKGLVQLVARSPEHGRNRERLEVVQAEVARMEEILADYLSFSRPLEDLHPQRIDLADVAADAAAVVAGRIEHGGLTLRLEGRRAPIEGDARRLKEALLNLLANAIEATPSGGSIIVASEPRDGGGARLVIRDSGRGIARADLDRLGTSFFTTRDGGTGLGVVLAQTAIAQHGGTLRYASEVGKGTTVTIELPARPPAAAAATADGAAGAPLEPAA
ncbi:MAG TPA: HAMP domain-containing sensor histidine kinase [Kofleriaceae bacterium]|nr:HAMP domain-containing sensor histidine kinase [Kofleriaceae bacterium]